jgi:uncharacterized protein
MTNHQNFEARLRNHIAKIATEEDPAHDILHFERVVRTAKSLAKSENAKLEIVVPGAWLHDLVIIPKNDPRRKIASRMSAEAAAQLLNDWKYPEDLIPHICHCIEAHSFSANIPPKTLEAKIVQDADRLDGLGAIGIARCFATAGLMKRSFYSVDDPFCDGRLPNDQKFTIDHFYQKLFKTVESLQTEAGRQEGTLRLQRMKNFLEGFRSEIGL